jgi:hypothetical protein
MPPTSPVILYAMGPDNQPVPVKADAAGNLLVTATASDAAVAAVLGTVADAAITTDANGTLSGKARGLVVHLVSLLARLPAALGAGNGLKIDGSGTPLPVSGTFYQAVQPVSIDHTTPGTTDAMRMATHPTAAGHAAKSGAGAAVSITLAAAAGVKHKVGSVVVGYDAAPPAGANLLITDDGAVVFQVPITAAGPAPIPVHLESAVANKVMVLTLSAGGGAIVGYLNIPDARTEA